MGTRTVSAATATFMVAVTGVLVPIVTPAPAAAAACDGDRGVTAIVDFNELGGGVTAGCDRSGGGKAASQVFTDAGYSLTFVQQDPGFVCRISGKPAEDPCVRTPPGTAYWSLWWSDGESGEWRYASSGVSALEVPDGGYVAFAWHQGDERAAPPDATPTPHEPEDPSDGPSDHDGGTGGGNGGGGNGGGGDGGGGNSDDGGGAGGSTTTAPSTSAPTATDSTTGATGSESASPDRSKKRRDREGTDPTSTATSSSAVPAADEITAGPPPSDLAADASDDGGSLPTWIGLALAVLVLGAAGLVTLLRRRSP